MTALLRPRTRAALVALGIMSLIPVSASAVTGDDVITTVAGSGSGFAGDGGPASQALLRQPRDTDVGADGTIYVTDTYNQRIRAIAPDGTIRTIAGNGSTTYDGDGIPATRASLHWPHDVTVDDSGVVFIADSAHHRVRRVGLDGTITTVAGTGSSGSSGDGGPATSARTRNPKGLLLHGGGLYFSSLEHKVRRVDLVTGIITTVAGTGAAGYSGDGGPAVRATLDSPQRIVADPAGNIYVADSGNNAVRRVDASTGVITTVAGTGVAGLSGDGGPARSARLDHPRGIEIEGSTLYVADSNNHRVRRVDLTEGTIHPLAGTVRGFAGDGGPVQLSRLYQPRGLTLLSGGRLLVADTFNNRLRVIDPDATGPGPGPDPDPGSEMFTNRSVEDGPTGFDGVWSTRDEVTWSTQAAVDGTHAMRIANTGTSAQATGLLNQPLAVTSTRLGHTYIATAWVRATQPDQQVMLRVQECAATCLAPRARTITLDTTGWHQVTRSLVAQAEGSEVRYAVVAKALQPGSIVYADLFGMTRLAP